jgi:uncharacterized membrane protein YkoI
MRRIMIVISGIVLTAVVAIGGVSSQQAKLTGSITVKNDDEAALAGMSKIPIESAMKEALKTAPGVVVKTELEDDNGYLFYGIDIAKANREISDIKVDADHKDHED